jgi:mannosyltransferase OCH1-like enzyme
MMWQPMIPKLIHHLWIDPSSQPTRLDTIPSDILENLASWRRIEPGYQQKVWLIEEIVALCQTHNLIDVVTAINSCRFPSMKADIARLVCLNIYGGFWVDLKLYLNLRFLDRLVGYDLVLTTHFAKDDLPDPTGHLSNSFIGASPNNIIISRTLEQVARNVNNRMKDSVYHITGATNLMNSVKSSDNSKSHFIFSHQATWDYLFTIRGGSYNGVGMHWSQREKKESPYVS